MSSSTHAHSLSQLSDDDLPSQQLHNELRDSIAHGLKGREDEGEGERRPILTHLNADTTWLLSIPIPMASQSQSQSQSQRQQDPFHTPPYPSPYPSPPTSSYQSPYYQSPFNNTTYKSPYAAFAQQQPTKPYVSPQPPPPKPKSQKRKRERIYYHILIDPWLRGSQSDVAAFFSTQWHAVPSACQSIGEVEDCIKGIEKVAGGMGGEDEGSEERMIIEDDKDQDQCDSKNKSVIDAVVVSHEFTDHMHQDTLLEIPGSVPVHATNKAAGIIRSWKHFESVRDIGRFTGNWRDREDDTDYGLPDWLSITRLAYPGRDLLYYHSAIMITFTRTLQPPKGKSDQEEAQSQSEAEAIIYTPHGIAPSIAAPIASASPPIKTLALLHGLQDIQIRSGKLPGSEWLGFGTSGVGAQLNLGAHNGLLVQRLLDARYWIGTHDEEKKGGGIVSWWLRRKRISVREALEMEVEEGRRLKEGEDQVDGDGNGMEGEGLLDGVRFVELGSGESLVLEV